MASIADEWTVFKASLIGTLGYDEAAEWLEQTAAVMRLEANIAGARLDAMNRMGAPRPTTPDYAALAPHDLRSRIVEALQASEDE